jgi:hypothetical protein
MQDANFYRPQAIDLTNKFVMQEYDDDRVPMDARQRHIQQRVYSIVLAEEHVHARRAYGEPIPEDKLS